MEEYPGEWNRMKVKEPKSRLEIFITEKILHAIAEGLKTQRGMEYWFSSDNLIIIMLSQNFQMTI